jgi:hypothetical protein
VVKILFGVVLIWSASALAITPDELRRLANEAHQQHKERDARLKSGDVGKLVPQPNPDADSEVQDEVRSTKYAVPASNGSRTRAGIPNVSDTTSTSTPQGVTTVTPSAPSGRPAIYSDAVSVDTKRLFGVRLGTWLEARVNRDVTNAEPGLVELTVTTAVVGDKKTLPAGTLLFAAKQLNAATKRMELKVQKGITPTGIEFAMAGQIFDMQRTSGLLGIISGDTGVSIKRGASKGALAAVGAAARAVPGPLSQAGGAAVDSVTNDAARIVDEETEQRLTIYVAAQPVLIRVEETF